jgi:hypothetical protein
MSPLRDNGVVISHREVDGSDDGAPNWHDQGMPSHGSSGESITPGGSEIQDVIMGQDPNELAGLDFNSHGTAESALANTEMQEKQGTPSLLGSAMENITKVSSRPDIMDVDEIMTDEAREDMKPVKDQPKPEERHEIEST